MEQQNSSELHWKWISCPFDLYHGESNYNERPHTFLKWSDPPNTVSDLQIYANIEMEKLQIDKSKGCWEANRKKSLPRLRVVLKVYLSLTSDNKDAWC